MLFNRAEAVVGETVSVEHVPAESVGGRALLLSCSSCNSTVGHSIESHLPHWWRATALAQGHAAMLDLIVNVGSVEQHVNAESHANGDVELLGVLKAGPPETPERVHAALDQMVANAEPVRIGIRTRHRFSMWNVRLSVLPRRLPPRG